jgi:hypothetical protein
MTNRSIDQVVIEAGCSGAVPFAQRPEGGKLWLTWTPSRAVPR